MNLPSQKPTVTTEKFGGNDDSLVYKHPAFGMIRFGRTNGSQKLFGSEVDNAGHISVEVMQGQECWHLHKKHYCANSRFPIIRLAMSYSQFAEAITNQNCGDGVPCTLEYINGERIPSISENTVSVSDQIKLDIKEQGKKITDTIDLLEGQISGLKLSEKQKDLLIQTLNSTRRELKSNLPFIISQCEEAVEHLVTKAKVEVEAFAQSRIHQLGMQALAEKGGKLIEG